MGDEDSLGSRVSGVREIGEALTRMERRVDAATIKALKASQRVTRTAIKGRMRGRPRWGHRGASARTGANVTVDRTQGRITRAGGPGKLSGALLASIRSSKQPRRKGDALSAAVMSGGAGGPQNLYKKHVEARFPYFKTGAEAAEKKLPKIWEDLWRDAVHGPDSS
ncbi:hypothetical protein CFP65_3298 [Kitasatospora sp. MMS16-BH015]|uniref:hypothetical protein n=1 Tax=Kitasatospora sp. MMS16-BH015 TaxID=2018025 RepID=UPI000CA1BE7D|nr:hypothetical protein [Kitasatospora sp. MMS16-BH015]AUG78098.1 hypothetical protein CFP65_3298 [Kitasatospora sp. MMS16-BH015]